MKTTTRLGIVLAISLAFFCAEIAIGFRTKSLALIADAFHYLNDVIAYVIAFVASFYQGKKDKPAGFTYAYHRAELVGAFFNGVFLLALALSIFLQSIERFIRVEPITDPLSVLIVGCVGLILNILSAFIMHDHANSTQGTPAEDVQNLHHEETATTPMDTAPQLSVELVENVGSIHALHNHVRAPPPGGQYKNLGVLAVFIHVLGDAVNNIGVIVAAVIMWQTHSPARFYADPAVSIVISLIIFASAIPLTKSTGRILLEASPIHLNIEHIKQDLQKVKNVISIHDLHIWHLSQSIILSSFHVQVPPETTLDQWEQIEKTLRECMAAYGITHVTIAPEISTGSAGHVDEVV